MKILNLLNPQKWGGQILLLVLFGTTVYGLGYVHGIKSVEIPPTTQVNVKQKFKGNKKGSSITSNLTGIVSQQNCNEWLRGLSMKEIKALRK